MKVTNRKDVRTAIKASLDAFLVGPGKPVQYVYKYQTGEFLATIESGEIANVSVLVIAGDGSDRQGSDSFISAEQTIFLNIHSFILYEKEDEWTEEQSEDGIDDVEAALIEWWGDNADRRNESATPSWLEMHLLGRSEITSAFIGGIEYRHEAFQFGLLVANTE